MASNPPMIQIYRDEEGSVGEHAPFLSVQPADGSQPRRAKKPLSRSRLAIASGVLTIWLLFCAWYHYVRSEDYMSHRGPSGVDFPHRKLPWPFPKHPHPHHPKRPHDPPGHHHFFPSPTVLACIAVPTPTSVSSLASVELKVTIPGHKALVLKDYFLHGDVSVTKVDEDSDATALSEGKNLTVGITVTNRTCHHPPPQSVVSTEEESEKEEAFVLCAITWNPPCKHKPHPDEETEEDKPAHPHPHPHPHHRPSPPVVVTILPALNETYPKFPGHGHHHPHHPPGAPPPPPDESPEDEDEEGDVPVMLALQTASVFSRAMRSTISFLFPMLSVSFPRHRPHHPFPHHHPPPPPPFIVTSLTVSVPKHVPVQYGHPFFGPPGHHWKH